MGASVAGYLDECFGDVPSYRGTLPYFVDHPVFAVEAERRTDVGAIGLARAVGIEGTLVDDDGDPVAGVRVQGDSEDGPRYNATGVTDATGHYVLGFPQGHGANGQYVGRRLPQGRYRVYFNTHDVPGVVAQVYRGVQVKGGIAVGGGSPTLVDPAPGEVAVADDRLGAAATLRGTLTDDQGAALRAGVSLRHRDDFLEYGYTDAEGRYAFDRLPAGDYTVCFHASQATGGHSTTGYLDSCREATEVTAGEDRDGVDHVLTAASGIAGTVLDPTSKPVKYATVNLSDEKGAFLFSTTSESDGTYRFDRLPVGGYRVCSETSYPKRWVGCHDRAADVAGATLVRTVAGGVRAGIDVRLASPPDVDPPLVRMTLPRVASRRVGPWSSGCPPPTRGPAWRATTCATGTPIPPVGRSRPIAHRPRGSDSPAGRLQ